MVRDAAWGKVCRITQQLGATEPATSEENLQDFVDRVIRSKWFGSRLPEDQDRQKLHVTFSGKILANHSPEQSSCDPGLLTHKAGRKTYDLFWRPYTDWNNRYGALHAIVHLLMPEDSDNEPWHNARFCHTFVLAVGRFVGKPEEAKTRQMFKDAKVKLYKWTPEARAKAAERRQERKFASVGDRLAQLASRLEGDDW